MFKGVIIMSKEIKITKNEYNKYKEFFKKYRIIFIIIDLILIVFVSLLLYMEYNFYSVNENSEKQQIEYIINFNNFNSFQDWYNYAEIYNERHNKFKLEYKYIENGLDKNGRLSLIKNICGIQPKNIKDFCVFIYGEEYNIGEVIQ